MPTTLNQFSVFIAMVYGGLAIGLIYDVFCAIRVIVDARRYISALLDALFWLLTACICFVVLYWANGGELRMFCIVGFCLGAGVYLFGISRVFRRFFASIAAFFRRKRTNKPKYK